MSCRLVYQSQVVFAVEHEIQAAYRAGKGCSFVTLTYDDHSVPFAGSDTPRPRTDNATASLILTNHRETLLKRDVQLFNKRLRINLSRKYLHNKYKYVFAGEYGDQFGRPHYHALFIGLADVEIATFVRSAWSYGLPQVGPLKSGGVRYVLKYITKSPRGVLAKQLYDDIGIERPFLLRSKGMAYDWLFAHMTELEENNFTYSRKGTRVRIPAYYERLINNGVRPLDPHTAATIRHAAAEANQDVIEYMQSQAILTEESLISAARSAGSPVDDTQLIYAKKFMRQSASVNRLKDDIIPF